VFPASGTKQQNIHDGRMKRYEWTEKIGLNAHKCRKDTTVQTDSVQMMHTNEPTHTILLILQPAIHQNER
jgi:hypothetical protein